MLLKKKLAIFIPATSAHLSCHNSKLTLFKFMHSYIDFPTPPSLSASFSSSSV